MKTLPLSALAHGRSGDKGPNSNVGLIAFSPEIYAFLKRELTPERVKTYFAGIVLGEVQRYELENLLALNFILGDSLGGGGSESLLNDAQGKTHAQKLLAMHLAVPDDLELPASRRPPESSGPPNP